MKKLILIFSLITAFSAKAEDSYQNCYGAANCMTASEFAYRYASQHPEVITSLYGSLEEYRDAISFEQGTVEMDDGENWYYLPDERNFYLSISNDGKDMVIYGPKEEGETYGKHIPSYTNNTFSFFDGPWDPGVGGYEGSPFNDITSLTFEGNFEKVRLTPYDLPNLQSLTIPDSVEHIYSLEGFDSLTDLTISDKTPLTWMEFRSGNDAFDTLEGLEEYRSALGEEQYQRLHQELEECLTGGWCEVWGDWEGEFEVNVLSGLDLSKVNIHCSGDINKCKENMARAGYQEGSYNMASANNAKQQKRRYTLEEAVAVVKPEGNTFKLRYR